MSFAGHEANALVQLGSEPNVFADLRAVADGDVVQPLNVVGRLDRDRAAVVGALSRFLPVGFSYPVVPQGKARIRTQMSAALTREDLDTAIHSFAEVGREMKLIA